MRTQNTTIYSAVLNNNCPECYSNAGLNLEFLQEFKENRWYKKYTDSLTSTMQCSKCNTAIYPVSWTEDIERVYEYHKINSGLKSTKTNWKVATLIVVLAIIAVLTIGIVLALNNYK